jgi:hypothetical protein
LSTTTIVPPAINRVSLDLMHPILSIAPAILALVSCSVTQPPAVPQAGGTETATLPVRSVQLYETGVGYFERAGKLTPGKDTLSLPASHVDDALKTLVILSDGAPLLVSAVEFESVLSEALARVQAGLPSNLEQRLSYPILLQSLRGVTVEILQQDGRRVEGRLVEVAQAKPGRKPAKAGAPNHDPDQNADRNEEDAESDAEEPGTDGAPSTGTTPTSGHSPANTNEGRSHDPRYFITIVEPNGAIARFDSARISSLRPLNPAIAKRLDSAVTTAAGRGAQSPRAIRISAATSGPIRIGYVTETPVWRVTYRLILGKAEANAALQGWVLVHNDTDEHWQSIALEIVNGKPDSFLYPLTAPRYLRRPLNTPEEEMSTLPQLARKTPDQIWGDREDSLSDDVADDASAVGGLGLSGAGEGSGGGYGSGHGSLGGRSAAPKPTSEITVGNLASLSKSEAMPSGANFRYRIAQPITLSAHSSALVPFTQIPVTTELTTRFAWGDSEGRVSVQVKNGSGQTLPAGPIAIYGADGLAGESTLVRLASGQSSWLSYGVDLDTEIEHRGTDVVRTTTKVLRLENQTHLVEHYVRHLERSVHLTNRSVLERQICIELPVGSNAQVVGTDRLEYDPSASKPLGIFDMLPRSDLDRTLVIEEALQKSTALNALSEQKLAELMSSKDLEPQTRTILAEAYGFLLKSAGRHRKLESVLQQQQRLETDTKRLEAMIEKLKGTSGNGAEPLVRRLVELEAARNRAETEHKAILDTQALELPALAKILERLNPSKT